MTYLHQRAFMRYLDVSIYQEYLCLFWLESQSLTARDFGRVSLNWYRPISFPLGSQVMNCFPLCSKLIEVALLEWTVNLLPETRGCVWQSFYTGTGSLSPNLYSDWSLLAFNLSWISVTVTPTVNWIIELRFDWYYAVEVCHCMSLFIASTTFHSNSL